MEIFERELGKLFDEALSAQDDTLWFSETETLYDAILRIYDEDRESAKQKTADEIWTEMIKRFNIRHYGTKETDCQEKRRDKI